MQEWNSLRNQRRQDHHFLTFFTCLTIFIVTTGMHLIPACRIIMCFDIIDCLIWLLKTLKQRITHHISSNCGKERKSMFCITSNISFTVFLIITCFSLYNISEVIIKVCNFRHDILIHDTCLLLVIKHCWKVPPFTIYHEISFLLFAFFLDCIHCFHI